MPQERQPLLHASRHRSRGTEIRTQSSHHTVTKPGTVAGLPAGQLDNNNNNNPGFRGLGGQAPYSPY